MKRFRFRMRTWIVLGAVAAVAAAIAVGGYAYFTATGSGTGSATTGSVGNLTIQNDPPTGIWPDGVGHNFNVYVYNPGSGNQWVNTISGNVQTFSGCWGYWFTVSPIVVHGYVAPGWNTFTGTITMPADDSDDQTGCTTQPLTINWSSN